MVVCEANKDIQWKTEWIHSIVRPVPDSLCPCTSFNKPVRGGNVFVVSSTNQSPDRILTSLRRQNNQTKQAVVRLYCTISVQYSNEATVAEPECLKFARKVIG